MKKTLTTVACSMVAIGAFAQGQIYFLNNNQINDNTGAAAGPNTGGNFEAEIVIGTTASAVNQFIAASINPMNGGYFNGPGSGIVTLDGTQGTPTIAPGTGIFYQVAVWSTTTSGGLSGLSFAQAEAAPKGLWGLSTVNPYTLGGNPPNAAPGSLNFATFGMTLNPAPEPATLALGAMGLGSLLLFRRRK
jgi:hypothetical protein